MVLVCNCFTQYYAVPRFPAISINLKNIKAGFVNWLVCNKSEASMTSGLSDEEFHEAAEKYIVSGSSSLLAAISDFYQFMQLVESVRLGSKVPKEAIGILERVRSKLNECASIYSELIEYLETYGYVPENVKKWFAESFDLNLIEKMSEKYVMLSQEDLDVIKRTFKEGRPLEAVKLFRHSIMSSIEGVNEIIDMLKARSSIDEKDMGMLLDKIWITQKKLIRSVQIGSAIAMINIYTKPLVESIRRG